MTSSAPTPLRQLIENSLSQLTAETESLFAEARERARRETADQLNQAVRRIRQAVSLEELTATLANAAGGFASGAMLFRIEENTAKAVEIAIPLEAAAALRGAIDTRDPVIAAASESEVSALLLTRMGQPADGRVCIFPLVVGESVPAVVCAWGGVQGSSVELLTQVAAAAWLTLAAPPAPAASDLILIAPAAAAAPASLPDVAPPEVSAWEQLPPEEQRAHLRAQRFARVQVAEMRLLAPDAVHAGRARRDLYDALRKSIDDARAAFRTQFFEACPSMVDYLHLELVRTLANEDPELLGKDYPGLLV